MNKYFKTFLFWFLVLGVQTLFYIFSRPVFWGLLIFYGALVLLVIWIHIQTYIGIYLGGKKLKKKLSKDNRLLTLEDAKLKVSKGEGTVIIEAPTLGWNVNRLWWCSDRELAGSKYDFENDHEEFIFEACENYDKYISEETGTAKLIDIFVITQKTENYLKKHFGHHDVCFVPSAMVWLHRESEKKQKDK